MVDQATLVVEVSMDHVRYLALVAVTELSTCVERVEEVLAYDKDGRDVEHDAMAIGWVKDTMKLCERGLKDPGGLSEDDLERFDEQTELGDPSNLVMLLVGAMVHCRAASFCALIGDDEVKKREILLVGDTWVEQQSGVVSGAVVQAIGLCQTIRRILQTSHGLQLSPWYFVLSRVAIDPDVLGQSTS